MKIQTSWFAFRALAVALVVVSTGACDSLADDLLTYDEVVTEEITVPGQDILGGNPLVPNQVFPADFGTLLSAALEQSFSTEGVDEDAVKSLKVTAMSVVVKDPEENGRVVRHLGFISSLSFDMGGGEQEPTLVADSAVGAFDSDPIEYDFETTNEELVTLLAEEEMSMTANLETDNQPTFATTLEFSVTVTVTADPAGALF